MDEAGITWGRRRVLAGLMAALLLVAAPTIAAQEAAEAPAAIIRGTVDRVIAVLADTSVSEVARRRQVRAIIGEHFDFVAMSKRVLATNWSKADKEQRKRFTSLFRELLSNTYWRRISAYTNETVSYTGSRLRSDSLATVTTVINTATADIPVDYMLYARNGRWLAYDVVIEQVSLVRNYRGSFQDIVHQHGIDGLIKQLEVKVAETSAAAAE